MKLVRQVMGSITLDPASCAAAQEVVQADVFFTVKEDGLSRSWFGNAWLNPPFVSWGQKFIEKLLLHFSPPSHFISHQTATGRIPGRIVYRHT